MDYILVGVLRKIDGICCNSERNIRALIILVGFVLWEPAGVCVFEIVRLYLSCFTSHRLLDFNGIALPCGLFPGFEIFRIKCPFRGFNNILIYVVPGAKLAVVPIIQNLYLLGRHITLREQYNCFSSTILC